MAAPHRVEPYPKSVVTVDGRRNSDNPAPAGPGTHFGRGPGMRQGPGAMTAIILVRHGHVEGITPERFRGRADLPLTELGRRQAAAVAREVAARCRPEAIYASPLARCRDTAAAIGAACGVAPQTAAGLVDIDYGDWQGLSREAASARWPEEVARWFRVPHLAAIPNGESLAALSLRAGAALHDILRRHPHGTVVAVAHDTVNRVLLLQALELPLSRFWRIKQQPCAINQLDFDGDAFTVCSLNEAQHFPT